MLKKQIGRTEFTMETDVQVVVVDLGRSEKYPLNFVCVFPQIIISGEKRINIFGKIFGTGSLEVAKKAPSRGLEKGKRC